MNRSPRRLLGCVLMTFLVLGQGCAKPTGKDGGRSPAEATVEDVRIIPLTGGDHLYDASTLGKGFTSGGLVVLGDINGDQWPDFAVALRRKDGKTEAEKTAVEAYSGKDGARLWQTRGQYAAGTDGYMLGHVTPVGDFDSDGVPDLYVLESWSKRSALVFSGKTGALLRRFRFEPYGIYEQPLRSDDFNGDGVPDIVFLGREHQRNPLAIDVHSGKDFASLKGPGGLWAEATDRTRALALPEFHDVNGDGVSDWLVQRAVGRDREGYATHTEFAVVSGKEYGVLAKFQSPRPRITSSTAYSRTGDLNRDGTKDLVFAAHSGGGPTGRTSLLRAVSVADGATLWQVTGHELPGGKRGFTVDVKTRQRQETPADVEFGSPVVVVPDRNGDGVDEIVTTAQVADGNASTTAVLVFSGSDGKLLATLRPAALQGFLNPYRTQLIFLPAQAGGAPTVAVAGRSPRGEPLIALFALGKTN
jgi:hypothetical protein